MEKARQTRKVAPPDGGYGWVATFGVSLVNVSTWKLLQIAIGPKFTMTGDENVKQIYYLVRT